MRASMGPSSFNDGDMLRNLPLQNVGNASMGPSSFNDGDAASMLVAHAKFEASMGPSSFNDGDGHIPSTLSTIDAKASMGPSSFNDGDDSTANNRQDYSPASMGPSSFNDGDRLVASLQQSRPGRFNGAVVFQRRRSVFSASTRISVNPLQWGRRLSTTEISKTLSTFI